MYNPCNFIPPKMTRTDLDFYHFVYENNLKKLIQPFRHPIFYMCLVYRGNAVLETEGRQFPLERGAVFFFFPETEYFISNDKDFSYLYITFDSSSAQELLRIHGIERSCPVIYNFEHIIQFWMTSFGRVNPRNANSLTESVFLYTLSYIDKGNENENINNSEKFESILKYVNYNFTSRDMSVKKVADIFFYSEKYLSSLFIKKTGVKFTQFVNDLRIKYAIKLIKGNNSSISGIAYKSGFNDPLYFSKVFKKGTGKTPTEFIKELNN